MPIVTRDARQATPAHRDSRESGAKESEDLYALPDTAWRDGPAPGRRDGQARRWIAVATVFAVAAALMGLFELDRMPAPWWDEGWTLCVARQWVETGHYGCLLEGRPAPPILAGHFPVVASIAAGFQLLGVGLWQARFVEVLYSLLTLALLYGLALRCFDQKVATVTLVLALFLPVNWQMHPLILGRQVLGEMPMLCFLLAGYLCATFLHRHPGWWVGAVGCWGLALWTKAQVRPFWTLSLTVPLVWSLARREWRTSLWVSSAGAAAWGLFMLLGELKSLVLAGHTLPTPAMTGLLQASALVFAPRVRLDAVIFTATFLVPTLCGLGAAVWSTVAHWQTGDAIRGLGVARVMLLTFAVSWFGWFFCLSLGGARYAFPMWFTALPFVAALMVEWSQGLDLRAVHRELRRQGGGPWSKTRAVGVVSLALLLCWMTVQARLQFRGREADQALPQVVEYLHGHVPTGAMIETYESELFLLLDRPYHYPPAELNVDLIRQGWHAQRHLTYDPLQADPDYVVVGEFGRWANLYQSLVDSGQIRLIHRVGRYQVYERVRPHMSPATP